MSTSVTPSRDLVLNARIPATQSLFTTFAKGHFIKPGEFTQPAKAAISARPATFAGCYTEVYAAAPIDLDYDEPNAVVETEMEIVSPTSSVHQMELPGERTLSPSEKASEKAVHRMIPAQQRSAA